MGSGTTVSENTAVQDGGGIVSIQTMTLNASTVRGNTAGERGGGIANFGFLALDATEVTRNTAPTGAGVLNYGAVTIGPGSSVGNNAVGDCTNGFGGSGCSLA